MTSLATAVSYWTKTIGAHIIEYDSVTKKTLHKKWNAEDDTKIYYKSNLRTGLYNNGIAVRTGLLHRGPYTGQYLGCIDFDHEDTFLVWCGDDYNLESLAKWTRVEGHKNPAKLHVFFISKTPLRNMRHKGIEVYSERPNLICVYGIHKDGNRIDPYDTKKIVVVDDSKLSDIQNRIKSVIPDHIYDYHRDDNTTAHNRILELERPETVVGSGHVHNDMAKMMTSVFLRYTDNFIYMSDEERLQYCIDWDKRKALQAKRPAYIDANPFKLKRLWDDVKRKYGPKRQQERDERIAYDNNIHVYRSNRPMVADVAFKSVECVRIGSLNSRKPFSSRCSNFQM